MDQFLYTLKDEGIHRYDLKTDVDQPKSDIIVPDYLATWDLNKNDPTKKRRLVNTLYNFSYIYKVAEEVYAGR